MSTRRSVAVVILIALLLSSLPYLWGYFLGGSDQRFLGMTHNIDDGCVYLSWMRQAAEGHFFIRNQFAVEPQKHLQFNVLFLVLGGLARLLHIPLIGMYHLARIVFGALLLLTVYRFGKLFLKDREERLALLIVAAFSSGIGWLWASNFRPASVDMWQPEAITFLSIYLNPLFLCAQTLMLASLICLMRMSQTCETRYGLAAGGLLLLLGNIHTYDVVTVGSVWLVYIVVRSIADRRLHARTWILSALAALVASPSLLYQWYLYHSEPVFQMRADTWAISPPVWWYFTGYGIILILAAVGVRVGWGRKDSLLLRVWCVIGFALAYVPFAQQRKLIMGLHIPLAILAVFALVRLAPRLRMPLIRAALLVALITVPSNIVFMWRDAKLLEFNQSATMYNPPFLGSCEIAGLNWLDQHTQSDDIVFAFPGLACLVPVFTDARTYVGHWSETPSFGRKLHVWRTVVEERTSDGSRMSFLRQSRITYVWWDTRLDRLPNADFTWEPVFKPDTKPYLRKVFASGSIRIYTVVVP